MHLAKNIKLIILIFLVTILNFQNSSAFENKILFKVDNEIITTIDIYEEIKFLKIFKSEMKNLDEQELFEISKNSILRDKIKKVEIMNFVKELKVEDKFVLGLIKNNYPILKKEIIREMEINRMKETYISKNITYLFQHYKDFVPSPKGL